MFPEGTELMFAGETTLAVDRWSGPGGLGLIGHALVELRAHPVGWIIGPDVDDRWTHR